MRNFQERLEASGWSESHNGFTGYNHKSGARVRMVTNQFYGYTTFYAYNAQGKEVGTSGRIADAMARAGHSLASPFNTNGD